MAITQGKYKLATSKGFMDRESGGHLGSLIKVPAGMSIYKMKVGKAKLDIVPYPAGANNPRADEGMYYWERTFWVHRGIGPNEATVLCLARTFEKPCPICEGRQRLLKNDETEEAEALKPKEWVAMLIRDRNDKEKGIQLSVTSFHRFADKVHDAIASGDAEDNFDSFWHPSGGKLLRVNWGEDSAGDRGGKYIRAKTVMFEERQDLPESLVDKAPSLDELLITLDYKKLKALFESGDANEDDEEGEESEDEDDKPKKKKKPSDDEDEESEESESEDEEDRPKKKKKASEDEEESESEDDEEEKPKKKKPSEDDEGEEESEDEEERPKKKKKPSEDDEESEDEEEEEQPKKKKKASEDEEESESEDDEEEKPKKKKSKEEDDESESESEDEEEEKPKKKKAAPAEDDGEGWDGFDEEKPKKKKSKDAEESESEDEEEDEKPKKKKK